MINIGEKYIQTKKMAPTHPHPSAPNKPPMETIGKRFF